MGKRKKIILGLLALIVVIQFVRIDKTNPEVNLEMDFISINNPPAEVQNILKTSCYDCHSYESVYPWYSNIAPVSWFLKKHINEGREHLNLSKWGEYEKKRIDHKLEEIVEEVQDENMPLKSYLIIHDEAKLSKEQRSALVSWVQDLRAKGSQNLN